MTNSFNFFILLLSLLRLMSFYSLRGDLVGAMKVEWKNVEMSELSQFLLAHIHHPQQLIKIWPSFLIFPTLRLPIQFGSVACEECVRYINERMRHLSTTFTLVFLCCCWLFSYFVFFSHFVIWKNKKTFLCFVLLIIHGMSIKKASSSSECIGIRAHRKSKKSRKPFILNLQIWKKDEMKDENE